jgi:hypothetical protein
VGRSTRVALVTGAVVISGAVALAIAVFVIVFVGESQVILQVCSGPLVTTISGVSHFGPEVCTQASPSPWSWVLPAATVLGAAAGGLGTSRLLRRHLVTSVHSRPAPGDRW